MFQERILYAPSTSHTARVFRPEEYKHFCEVFDVTALDEDRPMTQEEMAEKIVGMDALVTGWGVPALTEEFFENADRLQIIAHSAGSVKHLFPGDLWEKYVVPRQITVFSANQALAYNVAEGTVGYMISVPRRFLEHVMHVRTTTGWRKPGLPTTGQYLLGATVGIISASKVGREVIRLLGPFDTKILVFDPYLSDWEAGRLGVEKADLNAVFERSDIVSLHAPTTPETEKMIGKEQLSRMRDGALLINTSRGWVLDHDALYEEARTGRILVVLDVTTPEPLPGDHPLRKLENVYITPHLSGAGNYGYYRIGEMTVRALEQKFSGRPVVGAIRYETFRILA